MRRIAAEPKASAPRTQIPWLVFLCLGAFSTALALGIAISTGLVPKWGQWYSINTAYRRQTAAMLQGSFALSDDPRRLGYDMAWVDGAVQQVWGLGVPSWRLPFELLAKLFGSGAFPDRLALVTAMALLIFALFRLLVMPAQQQDGWGNIKRQPEALPGALFLVLFPPFLALCRTNFDVYEEAQAYTYLTGIALFALTVGFIRRPSLVRFLLLATASGLAGFVRPTLLCYGLVSVALAWGITQREGWRDDKSWAGPGVFCAGIALLLFTNAQRFGSGLEFGHTLNVNVFFPMMYATRFENPVLGAPLSSRVAELFSYLFLVREHLACCDGYASGIVPLQASVVRWRDVYFSTYDLTFLALMLPAWAASFVPCWRGRNRGSGPINEAAFMGLWSFLSAIPLVLLFLNYPVMSSRYMMDFAAAFAVAIWVALQLSCQLIRRRFPERPGLLSLPILLLAAWWAYQVATARIFPHTGGGTVSQRITPQNRDDSTPLIDLSSYTWPMETDYGIPFNGYGWYRADGRTASIVVFFLRGAQRLEVELRPVDGERVAQSDWDQIRVKIGLEELRRESSRETPAGRTLTFTRASTIADPARIEIAFLALTNAKQSSRRSKFQLQRVRWRDDTSR